MIRGGEFLIKDQDSKDVFIPEDFSDDQLMMASATKEFVEKELDPHRERFEQKDYKLTEECMKKVGKLGLLGIIFNRIWWNGWLFNTSVLICDRISAQMDLFLLHLEHILESELTYSTLKQQQKERYLPKLK